MLSWCRKNEYRDNKRISETNPFYIEFIDEYEKER